MKNPITHAIRAKGILAFLKRGQMILQRYGLSPRKIELALTQLSEILHRYHCSATFPTTAVAIKRHPDLLKKFQAQGIEFAVHGYTHIDYAKLTLEHQTAHLQQALDIFTNAGISAAGFRSPYLRREKHLLQAIGAADFSYVSNQPVLWNVLDDNALSHPAYKRAVTYYAPWYADSRPSLPRLVGDLVEIPVSLPDDEILLDRLGGYTNGLVKKSWLKMLEQSHHRGELLTIQLHPERTAACADGLSVVLAQARQHDPPVWIARLDEIADWWRNRTGATVSASESGPENIYIQVNVPPNAIILARNVDVDAPTKPWMNTYQQVESINFSIHSSHRPFIGLSSRTSSDMAEFLRQQGYIVEIGQEGQQYSYYFDQSEFSAEHELAMLKHIEETDHPLIRLGRWPDGAQSALAITGDIDAFTLWDYGLRAFGR